MLLIKNAKTSRGKKQMVVTPARHFLLRPAFHQSPRKFRLVGKIPQRESLGTRQSGKMAHRMKIIEIWGEQKAKKPGNGVSPFSRVVLINRPSQKQEISRGRKAFSDNLSRIFSPLKSNAFICVSECSVLFGTIDRGEKKNGSRASAVKSFCMFSLEREKIPQTLLRRWSSAIHQHTHTPTAEPMQHAKTKKKETAKPKAAKNTRKKAEKKKKKWFSWNLFRSSRNFLFYLFGERRWSWFCFQLCSKRWSHQTGKETDNKVMVKSLLAKIMIIERNFSQVLMKLKKRKKWKEKLLKMKIEIPCERTLKRKKKWKVETLLWISMTNSKGRPNTPEPPSRSVFYNFVFSFDRWPKTRVSRNNFLNRFARGN